MAPSAALRMVRHDDLIRASQAAGHVFAPVDDGQDADSTAVQSRFPSLSMIALAGFVASCGMFLALA